MDECKHCINCLMSRSRMLEMSIVMFPNERDEHDKKYQEILQWFKDTYELKRKPQTQGQQKADSHNKGYERSKRRNKRI